MKTCLNMPYGSTLSRGVSSKLSSSRSSSSSSVKDPNFCAWYLVNKHHLKIKHWLTYLLVQEVEVGSTVVRNIGLQGSLGLVLLGPLNLAIPVVVLIALILLLIKREVRLLSGVLAIY